MIHFDDAVNYNNIMYAYKHCRLGKTERAEVVKFHLNRDTFVRKLLKELQDETYEIKGLFTFTIYEPKKRAITANEFRDKLVEYVLSNFVLKPTVGPKLIYDNYATQDDKGSKAAIVRLIHNMESYSATVGYTDEGWVLSADVHHFFYEINREICMAMIEELKIDDKLKRLLHKIIYTIEDFDGTTRGLCIGFQTSQWLAVYYLNGLDHFIKEKLHIKYYGRYMDDFYLIHEDREYLEYCYEEIKKYVEDKLDLKLNPKTNIHPYADGINFVGFKFEYGCKKHRVKLRVLSNKVRNQKRKVKRLKKLVDKGEITADKALESITSWHAYAVNGETEKTLNLYKKAKDMFSHADGSHKTKAELRAEIEPIDLDDDGFFVLRPVIKNKKTGKKYGKGIHKKDKAKRRIRNSMHMLQTLYNYDNAAIFRRFVPLGELDRVIEDKKHRRKKK